MKLPRGRRYQTKKKRGKCLCYGVHAHTKKDQNTEREREGGGSKQTKTKCRRAPFLRPHKRARARYGATSYCLGPKKRAPKRNAGHPYATMQDCIIRRQARYQKRGKDACPTLATTNANLAPRPRVGREFFSPSPVKTDTAKSVNLCTTLRVG